MGLLMSEKRPLTREYAARYRRSLKKNKTRILDEFIKLTEYNRSYARYLLRNHGRKVFLGKNILAITDVKKKIHRQKPRIYGEDIIRTLKKIWVINDYICGKRLVSILPEMVSRLEKFKEIKFSKEIREKLCHISAATIDRALKNERKKITLKGRSYTKPGTLLKHQIPIRTFSEWDDKKPGFLEIDLVGHDGGNFSGEFGFTLDATDVATGWTEPKAVKNKASKWTFEALNMIKMQLPFNLLGIDSDNDAVFINDHLFRYCRDNKIEFTRTRSYRKNDNCYVEQKNWSVVRRAVGYYRYDTEEEIEILNKLYGYLRLYNNYFQPSMKLISKKRIGSRVIKRYDQAATPYQRILLSGTIDETNKTRIRLEYNNLNPAELKRQIVNCQDQLMQCVKNKNQKSYKITQKGHHHLRQVASEEIGSIQRYPF
jgi:hypothetical protein